MLLDNLCQLVFAIKCIKVLGVANLGLPKV